MHIDVLFAGQVSKDEMALDTIEDSFKYDIERGIVVISDGASESYDSRTLSSLVCSEYLKQRRIDREWLTELIHTFDSNINLASLSWSKEAAYKRGSFATLLAIKKNRRNERVHIEAIGDSQAILVTGGEVVDTYPYKKAKEFQQRPQLISTVISHNRFIFRDDYSKKHKHVWDISADSEPTILCMTDALGDWTISSLENGDERWKALLTITNIDQFRDFVISEWNTKEMRKDDVTLVRIGFS